MCIKRMFRVIGIKKIKSPGSLLHPRDVVDYARNPDTELHNYFEWGNAKAVDILIEGTAPLIVHKLRVDKGGHYI